MVTPTLPLVDASRAWVTIVADNNDEGVDEEPTASNSSSHSGA